MRYKNNHFVVFFSFLVLFIDTFKPVGGISVKIWDWFVAHVQIPPGTDYIMEHIIKSCSKMNLKYFVEVLKPSTQNTI